jgi:hypothetical protein
LLPTDWVPSGQSNDGLYNIIYSLFIKAALQNDIIPIDKSSAPNKINTAIRVEKMVENGPTEISVFAHDGSDSQDSSYYEMELHDWDRGQRGKTYVSKM